ncbi:MAG: lipid II flippase MurJ, partial [Hyphomicrobium sp.]
LGAVLLALTPLIAPLVAPEQALAVRVAGLAALVGTGLVIYASLIVMTGVLDRGQLGRFFRRGAKTP